MSQYLRSFCITLYLESISSYKVISLLPVLSEKHTCIPFSILLYKEITIDNLYTE